MNLHDHNLSILFNQRSQIFNFIDHANARTNQFTEGDFAVCRELKKNYAFGWQGRLIIWVLDLFSPLFGQAPVARKIAAYIRTNAEKLHIIRPDSGQLLSIASFPPELEALVAEYAGLPLGVFASHQSDRLSEEELWMLHYDDVRYGKVMTEGALLSIPPEQCEDKQALSHSFNQCLNSKPAGEIPAFLDRLSAAQRALITEFTLLPKNADALNAVLSKCQNLNILEIRASIRPIPDDPDIQRTLASLKQIIIRGHTHVLSDARVGGLLGKTERLERLSIYGGMALTGAFFSNLPAQHSFWRNLKFLEMTGMVFREAQLEHESFVGRFHSLQTLMLTACIYNLNWFIVSNESNIRNSLENFRIGSLMGLSGEDIQALLTRYRGLKELEIDTDDVADIIAGFPEQEPFWQTIRFSFRKLWLDPDILAEIRRKARIPPLIISGNYRPVIE